MAEADNVKLLKLIIGTDKKIRVYHTLGSRYGTLDTELKISPLQRDTINALAHILRDGRLLQKEEFRALGANLYEVLLHNPIGDLITNVALQGFGSDNESASFLRIELEFEDNRNDGNEEIRELLSWPWEYLYCTHLGRGMFLSETAQLVLTRRLHLNQGERELLIEDKEVRVLFVSASPQGLERVQSDTLQEVFHDESIKSRINLLEPPLITEYEEYEKHKNDETLPPPKASWQTFKAVVKRTRPHIIHFVGHGNFNAEKKLGEIAFVGPDYNQQWIDEEQLARELMGITELRLVFLQACESARFEYIANTGPYRAIAGIASSLAANNIPAIVAMQYEIGNGISNRFAREFYSALISSRAIEAAMIQGRSQILESLTGWSVSRAFGLPVLYLRDDPNRKPGILLTPPAETVQGQGQGMKNVPSLTGNALFTSVGMSVAGICPWCKTTYKVGAIGCINCGLRFYCKSCNALVLNLFEESLEKSNFCLNCLTPLDKPTSLPTTVAPDGYQRTGSAVSL